MIWKKRGKFGNKKITIDGRVFDSIKEGSRYKDLKILQEAKQISDLKCQVPFKIIVNHEKICVYWMDFTYIENGKKIAEEVKGYWTSVAKLKAKLFKALYHDYTYRVT